MCLVLLMCTLTIWSSVLWLLMVVGMPVVMNDTLSLMSVLNPPPILCYLSMRTLVTLCTLEVLALWILNYNDIFMCVVNMQFEIVEFIFNSICVDLSFTAGPVCLGCVFSHVVVLCLYVRLTWYPMWWVQWLWCVSSYLCWMWVCWESARVRWWWKCWCEGHGRGGCGGSRAWVSMWVIHVVQVLCLAQLMFYWWVWCVGWEELVECLKCVCVWLGAVCGVGGGVWVSGWEYWVLALPILWKEGERWTCVCVCRMCCLEPEWTCRDFSHTT